MALPGQADQVSQETGLPNDDPTTSVLSIQTYRSFPCMSLGLYAHVTISEDSHWVAICTGKRQAYHLSYAVEAQRPFAKCDIHCRPVSVRACGTTPVVDHHYPLLSSRAQSPSLEAMGEALVCLNNLCLARWSHFFRSPLRVVNSCQETSHSVRALGEPCFTIRQRKLHLADNVVESCFVPSFTEFGCSELSVLLSSTLCRSRSTTAGNMYRQL
jgi:hypothetical protein